MKRNIIFLVLVAVLVVGCKDKYKTWRETNMYSQPEDEYLMNTTLQRNVEFTALSEEYGWLEMDYKGERVYVKANDVHKQKNPVEAFVDEVVAWVIGLPILLFLLYLWLGPKTRVKERIVHLNKDGSVDRRYKH